jgi:hypothetical protein
LMNLTVDFRLQGGGWLVWSINFATTETPSSPSASQWVPTFLTCRWFCYLCIHW